MRNKLSALALLLMMATLPLTAQTLLAPTPPMGWNSWDSYGLTINEAEFKANTNWLNQHLKRYGWQYVIVDEGWYLQNPESGGKPAWVFTLDKNGRYLPATNRFPSAGDQAGFKPLADYVHSLGLKFGIHIIRGIPREAVAKNMPILGSDFHAADAANTSDKCAWNPDNYGVKDTPAGQAYYDSLFQLYASWGLDYVKVDCISHPYIEHEIRMIHRAIQKTGRPILLSLSPGPTPLENAASARKYAQMWRISNDVWDHWDIWPDAKWSQSVKGQFATAAAWAPHVVQGHWPDADMLPIGYLGPRPGLKKARQTELSQDEQRTMLTLWSIFRSPLMMGGNLTRNDAWTTSLLTNAEVIAVDQHSEDNRPVITTDTTSVWTARPAEGKDEYVAVFNLGDSTQRISYAWNQLGLEGKRHSVRDLWAHKNLRTAKALKVTLRPHAAALYKISEK
ncbi:MAG: glycoside hydrolase family 27 protein [Acidobacteriaceae bacterium]